MAIPAVSAIYEGYGGSSALTVPTVTGEILASVLSGVSAKDLAGFCLPVLDGAATTFTLNWIDGTATLATPPQLAFAFKSSPPAWQASTVYPLNYVVLGSAHVQQVTVAGKTGSSAPTWSTAGSTVVDGSVTWKDLGAEALSTITAVAITAITTTSATVTISAAGTSTQIPYISFQLKF